MGWLKKLLLFLCGRKESHFQITRDRTYQLIKMMDKAHKDAAKSKLRFP
jgi:hypothetical protein